MINTIIYVISLALGIITENKVGDLLGDVIYKENGFGSKHPILAPILHFFGMFIPGCLVWIGTWAGGAKIMSLIESKKGE